MKRLAPAVDVGYTLESVYTVPPESTRFSLRLFFDVAASEAMTVLGSANACCGFCVLRPSRVSCANAVAGKRPHRNRLTQHPGLPPRQIKERRSLSADPDSRDLLDFSTSFLTPCCRSYPLAFFYY